MPESQFEPPTGATGPRSLADTLAEVTNLLNAHPEIKARCAFVYVDADERADLEALAAVLGERAMEAFGYANKSVEIKGRFGAESFAPYVMVIGALPIEKLDPEVPARPKYRPILRDLNAATREGRR